MGKIILFTNVKGGVGKTTLCSFFATYLSQSGRPVAVVDADIQQSLYDHRQLDLQNHPNAPMPWQIKAFTGMSRDEVATALTNLKKLSCDIIIDCPGNIIDPNLGAIYSMADIAVVPTHYYYDVMKATFKFAEMFKARFRAQMFFIPNNISGIEEGRPGVKVLREDATEQLKPYGILTARIKRSVIVAEYNTLIPLTSYQINAVKFPFKPIIEELEKGGVD
ncbi:MAG: ParA family protein [Prevotellaceae bacterium]|nr:ParA family protein [Prevotellaceae bacterium]